MACVNRSPVRAYLPRMLLVGLLGLTMLLIACRQNDTPAIVTSPAQETTPVLKVYNWDTYIDPEILTSFEQTYGVSIDYQIFDVDTDMMEELRVPGADYDVVVPSDFNVAIMRQEGLLAPLDKDAIPNAVNLDPTFVSPVFDPANRYCMPYQWGTVGIGYNLAATGREITSWADFFDPEFAGRVAMMDDTRTAIGLALLILGYSPNTTNPRQIAEATDFLISHADQIGAYTGDDGQDFLNRGEFDMVVEWSGDIFQIMEENEDIRYVIPEEGSLIWTDNLCIPATAPHKALAEQFINYILEPEIGAQLSNYTQFGTPNAAALPFIDEELLANPAVYPPESVRERLFFQVDVNLAATQLYDQAWAEIMEGHSS
ncbi:MAG: spermidine/putrescine ABC transporter substrate-binding protein [Candidatus Promineifilaceae bacterium]